MQPILGATTSLLLWAMGPAGCGGEHGPIDAVPSDGSTGGGHAPPAAASGGDGRGGAAGEGSTAPTDSGGRGGSLDDRGATLPCAFSGAAGNVVMLAGGNTSTPIVLDQPGTTYVLTEDVLADNTAFTVAADGITLDLDCHTVEYDRMPNQGTCLSYTSDEPITGNLCSFGIALGKSHRPQNFPDVPNPEVNLRGGVGFVARNGTIRQGGGMGAESHAVRNRENAGLVLRNLTLEIGGADTQALDSAYADDVTVEHCTVKNTSDQVTNRHQGRASVGISGVTGAATVRKNRIEGGPQFGVRIFGEGTKASPLRVADNFIAQTTIVTNGYGVGAYASYLTVQNNEIRPVRGRGIHLGGEHILVEDNVLDVVEAPNPEYPECGAFPVHGIKLEGATHTIVQNNDVTARAGFGFCWDASALNLAVEADSNNEIHHNVFTTLTDAADRIAAAAWIVGGDGSTTSIHDNVFRSNDVLVMWAWGGGVNLSFVDDTFELTPGRFAGATLRFDNASPVSANFSGAKLLGGANLDSREGCFDCSWHGPVDVSVQ